MEITLARFLRCLRSFLFRLQEATNTRRQLSLILRVVHFFARFQIYPTFQFDDIHDVTKFLVLAFSSRRPIREYESEQERFGVDREDGGTQFRELRLGK